MATGGESALNEGLVGETLPRTLKQIQQISCPDLDFNWLEAHFRSKSAASANTLFESYATVEVVRTLQIYKTQYACLKIAQDGEPKEFWVPYTLLLETPSLTQQFRAVKAKEIAGVKVAHSERRQLVLGSNTQGRGSSSGSGGSGSGGSGSGSCAPQPRKVVFQEPLQCGECEFKTQEYTQVALCGFCGCCAR